MIESEAYNKVKRAAVQAGVNTTLLCREAKVSPATLWRWRKGHSSANESTVKRLLAKADELKKNNEFLN